MNTPDAVPGDEVGAWHRRESDGLFCNCQTGRHGPRGALTLDYLNKLEADHASIEALKQKNEFMQREYTRVSGFYQSQIIRVNELSAEVEVLRAKAALADEMVKELKARERLSAVDALMFPRLTLYEADLIARYDVLTPSP